MLAEFYDEYLEFFNQSYQEIEAVINRIEEITDSADIEIFQNYLIQFGTVLEEKFCLYDSPLIQHLEQCCEVLYVYARELEVDNISEETRQNVQDVLREIKIVSQEYVCETSYHTSIVAIVKDEGSYIEEWLEYHSLVGISHFYIYDNDSTDGLKTILQPYIDQGIVTYRYFPGKLMQMVAYGDALKHYKLESKYFAVIDGDEFLVPMKEMSIPEVVDFIIEKYDKRAFRVNYKPGGIAVNWRCYGPSGHVKKQDGLIIDNYKMRALDDYDRNAHIKTICNPRLVQETCDHPHAFQYKKGYYAISEKGSYVPGAFFYDSQCEYIRINHYLTKSEEEYIEKWKRGWPDHEAEKKQVDEVRDLFQEMKQFCDLIEDVTMEKYVPMVKKKVEERRASGGKK